MIKIDYHIPLCGGGYFHMLQKYSIMARYGTLADA